VSLGDEIKIERYKYVLSQKQKLNDNTFKILALYQALCIALVSGIYVVYTAIEKDEISSRDGAGFLWAIVGLFELVSVFTIMGLAAGIRAWVGYRTDEIEIEAGSGLEPRAKPSIRSVFGWYETYFILFVMVAALVVLAVARRIL
jgi:hypothetical protein